MWWQVFVYLLELFHEIVGALESKEYSSGLTIQNRMKRFRCFPGEALMTGSNTTQFDVGGCTDIDDMMVQS